MDFNLKVKYNKTYFYFAIFFALVGIVFIIAAFMSYTDYSYAIGLASISGVAADPYYQQMVFDLRFDFYLNISFSIFALSLATFCGITRFNSSRSSRKLADI